MIIIQIVRRQYNILVSSSTISFCHHKNSSVNMQLGIKYKSFQQHLSQFEAKLFQVLENNNNKQMYVYAFTLSLHLYNCATIIALFHDLSPRIFSHLNIHCTELSYTFKNVLQFYACLLIHRALLPEFRCTSKTRAVLL